jgi:hypothetical protein
MSNRRALLKKFSAVSLSAYLVDAVAMGAHPLPPGIRSIKGLVLINGKPAKEGQLVGAGDSISTGKASEVVYVMGKNAYLMREDSSVNFALDGLVSVLRVVSGKVLGVFGPGQKRISIPTATIGIRGTACYIEISEAQTYFCLCYGSADITPTADDKQTQSFNTIHHETPFFIGTDLAAPLLKKAPVFNHSDVELTMLEALVGREPPFAGKPGIGY